MNTATEVTKSYSPVDVVATSSDSPWSTSFVALMAYVFIEYTRLAAMFPFLAVFQIGKIAVGIALIGVLLGHSRSVERRKPLDIALYGLITAALLSCVFAVSFERSFDMLWDGPLQWGMIFLIISKLLDTPQRLRIFVILLVILNLKLGQHAVRNYAAIRSAGVWSEQELSTRGVGAGSTGFFGNPGDFGVAMCVAWPLAGACLATKQRKLTRSLFFVAWAIFLIAIVLCGSRGALVGAFVVAIISVAKSDNRKLGAGLALLALILGLAILPKANFNRLEAAQNPEKDKTAAERLMLWSAGMDMFQHRPLLGVGLNNFRLVFQQQYAPLGLKGWNPHSIYVQVLSEEGILGAIPLLSLLLLIFNTNRKSRIRFMEAGLQKNDFLVNLTTGLDLALIGFMVSAAFLTVLWYPHLWIIAGLTAATYSISRSIEIPKKNVVLSFGMEA